MRNLSLLSEKWDKKYGLAFLIALICSVICGIVLCKFVNYNNYLRNLAVDYLYNAYNFKNGSLIFPHLLGDVLYFYIFFLIGYFTKFKYLNLIFVFFRGMFLGIYTALIITVGSFSGVIAVVFIFVPASIISLIFCFLVSEFCFKIDKRYVLFIPAVLAVLDCFIILLLINVLFRVVIIIV